MREQINDRELDQVVGGIVRVSGNKMKVNFTTLKQVFKLKNCEASDASLQAQILYNQHKDEGDLAYEQIVLNDFRSRGWID